MRGDELYTKKNDVSVIENGARKKNVKRKFQIDDGHEEHSEKGPVLLYSNNRYTVIFTSIL